MKTEMKTIMRSRAMNKTISTICVALVLLLSFYACDEDAHKDEEGLIVNLAMPGEDTASDVRLWIYQSDGLLVDEYHNKSLQELSSALLPLAKGEYVLIAATNLVAPFSADQGTANGAKPYEALVFSLDDASASPAHAHYGMQTVTVNAGSVTTAEVKMDRILSELQFTIKGVPAEVVKAEAKITNVAKSFLPYSGQLNPYTDVADLGSVTPVDGVISFPMKRLMPVVKAHSRAGTDAVPTLLQFTFQYDDGKAITFNAETSAIENGGTYTPEVVFDVFRPDMTVTITDINGWAEGEMNEEEILNPNN